MITSGGVAIAPAAQASGYKNCSAAHADGRYNIPQGDPDYKASQDRDGDGIACEG
nr:excalibur calcium-binding domain-containing protein [Mycolicibacterium llatzerense]